MRDLALGFSAGIIIVLAWAATFLVQPVTLWSLP